MRLESKITYLDGVRFRAAARGHELISDQPPDNGGRDNGMTPPELLLVSLGSCAAYYAAEYLRARNMSAAGLTVHATAEKVQRPARLSDFKIELSIPGLDDQRHREGVLRAAKNCLIHNTLLQAPTIELVFDTNTTGSEQPSREFAGSIEATPDPMFGARHAM